MRVSPLVAEIPSLPSMWEVEEFGDDRKKPTDKFDPWKTFALYGGATLQLGACIVVFGFLGYRLGHIWHHEWVTAIGVLVGVIVGASGLAFLAKQIVGDKSNHE